MPAASRYKLEWVPTCTLPVQPPLRVEDGRSYGIRVRGSREDLIAGGFISGEILDGVGKSGMRSIQTPVGDIRMQRMAKDWRVELWANVVSYLLTRDLLRSFNVEARPEGDTDRYAVDWLFHPNHNFETYC